MKKRQLRKKKEKISVLEKKTRKSLTLVYSLAFFANLLVTLAIITTVLNIFIQNGVIFVLDDYTFEGRNLLIFAAIVSLVFGSLLAVLTSGIVLRPFNRAISAMNRLADGDFEARLSFSKGISKLPVVNEVSESFNKMAEELENTEMLRSDFINNFSHEFKTPIVSIAGYAKLLRCGNLTDTERERYLAAIEEESIRLSGMATNVLNMTRIENQNILSDKSEYNVSEQIRKCVLLLEPKWSKRDIELDIDFQEYNIFAGKELLSEVWINLFDNAVKYTPDGGKISISISESDDSLVFAFSNTGTEIPPEKISKIWNKFYQADESHSASGNGVGLAIVKKIVELHGGECMAESRGGITVFTVILPRR